MFWVELSIFEGTVVLPLSHSLLHYHSCVGGAGTSAAAAALDIRRPPRANNEQEHEEGADVERHNWRVEGRERARIQVI